MKTRWIMIAAIWAMGSAAQAAPRAALFVQNHAGAALDAKLDAFADMAAVRLTEAGFEVVRPGDVLDRFTESRRAEAAQELRQAVEVLQTVKSEGTVDGPSREAPALRIAQLMEADYLVFASLLSFGENKVKTRSYGLEQEAVTTTLRVALRVLEGERGAQVAGDTLAVSDRVLQNAHLQVERGDQLNTLLDRGAADLAGSVRRQHERIAAARPAAPEWAQVTLATSAEGAAVEINGVVAGTAPGVIHVRPGVHEVRVTREGYATWEKSVSFYDGQVLDIPMELSAVGLARKRELEEQARIDDIARERSAAEAAMAEGAARQMSESYIRLEGMPEGSLTIGDPGRTDPNVIQVIQQEIK